MKVRTTCRAKKSTYFREVGDLLEERTYSVYMHENKINHKKYIGMTGIDPEKRWKNGKDYKNCIAFNRAINKYGWDGFDHLVLFSGLTREEACAKEIELIAQYQTTNQEFGYNICAGGGGMVGFHHSQETKRILSEKFSGPNNPNYGKPLSEKQLEILLRANLGSKHTEEHKRKIGDSLRGRHYSTDKQKKAARDNSRRPVERDDGVVFETIKEAAMSVGVCGSAITNSIKRHQRSGKHYWKYVDLKA